MILTEAAMSDRDEVGDRNKKPSHAANVQGPRNGALEANPSPTSLNYTAVNKSIELP